MGSLLLFLVCAAARVTADQASPSSLAQSYSLATSTSLAFPSQTASSSDAASYILETWGTSNGRFQDGDSNFAFVDDPYPDNPVPITDGDTSSGPVLRVTYPKGSYSHDTGGAQFYSLFNTTDSSTFGSMLITYEVAFAENFDWVKGGKLPGLRGGDNYGCSGGSQATGQDCFTARLMWRKNGEGEVYAYIPTPNNLCDDSSIDCNDDYGTSIDRGSFSFIYGQWNRVSMLVQLNDPVDYANGNLQVYYNDLQAVSQENLQFRSNSNVTVGGMYFSTFFGGADDSWATPEDTYTYYRNIQLWGSQAASTLSGEQVQDSAFIAQGSVVGVLLSLLFVLFALW